MTRPRLVRVCTILLAFCLGPPLPALAENTSCNLADYLFPGERAQYDIPANGSVFFKTGVFGADPAQGNIRSYAVQAWGPVTDAGEGGVSLAIAIWRDSACSVSAGASSVQREPGLTVPDHAGAFNSILPTFTGAIYIQVANLNAVPVRAHVLFTETTLFSPWWFVGGTNQAFVEMRNNMQEATSATVTLYRADGTVCGTVHGITLPGNGNAAVNVYDVSPGLDASPCTAALSGSAQIAFYGTPGGLTANLTTIDVPNGTSFDAPFRPRMSWSTFGR